MCKSDSYSSQPAATPNVVVARNYIVCWVLSVNISYVIEKWVSNVLIQHQKWSHKVLWLQCQGGNWLIGFYKTLLKMKQVNAMNKIFEYKKQETRALNELPSSVNLTQWLKKRGHTTLNQNAYVEVLLFSGVVQSQPNHCLHFVTWRLGKHRPYKIP